jgi:hypothetical protein
MAISAVPPEIVYPPIVMDDVNPSVLNVVSLEPPSVNRQIAALEFTAPPTAMRFSESNPREFPESDEALPRGSFSITVPAIPKVRSAPPGPAVLKSYLI